MRWTTTCLAIALAASLAFLAGNADAGTCMTTGDCDGGTCVDGFCCNAACQGQCEACDVTGTEGVCAPVAGSPHGARSACPSGTTSNPCAAASCDGVQRATCGGFAGPTVACRAASCQNGVASGAATCDGRGNCPPSVPIACGGFLCGSTSCKTSCATDADCATGNRCVAGSCVAVSGATCDGDHTVTDPGGNRKDCSPYTCGGGACKAACASNSDCVAPVTCDSSGRCEVAPNPPHATGCNSSVTGADPALGIGPLGLAGLALLAASRRRRRDR